MSHCETQGRSDFQGWTSWEACLHLLQVLAEVHGGGQRDGAKAQQRERVAVAARAAAAVPARQDVPVPCAGLSAQRPPSPRHDGRHLPRLHPSSQVALWTR